MTASLAALLLGAASAWSAPAPQASTGAVTMSGLIDQVLRQGDGAVIDAPLAGYLNVDAPTTCKVLHFREGADKLSHSLFLAVNPGVKPGELKPQFLFMVTRRVTPGLEERRYVRMSLSGQAEQITVVRERLDAKKLPVPDGRDVENVNVGDQKARAWIEHENEFYFKGKHRGRKR